MDWSPWLRGAAYGSALFLNAPVLAQQAEPQGEEWTFDATVNVVSDYRFRGYSLSDNQPAIQPEISITHASGFYASIWGSNIAANVGADIETDLAVGYNAQLGRIEADISANWYHYPDTQGFDFFEFTALMTAPAGPGTLGVELSYSPPQSGTGNASMRYAAITGALPLAGERFRIVGSLGLEDSAFGDNKLDWSLGMSTHAAGFEFAALYVDATRVMRGLPAEPAVVFSVRKDL